MTAPRAATSFAEKAIKAGWQVTITEATGHDIDPATGEPKRTFTLVADDREESDGKSKRVYGDPKVVHSVAVRCRRGPDYLVGLWIDGKFDVAIRPKALKTLSSTEATKHLTLDAPCRWLPSNRVGVEVCPRHGETRAAA